MNRGYFILGGGEEATDLYEGNFTTVRIVDDSYYHTNICALYIGDTRIGIPQYPNQPSNSCVDSGTRGIVLPAATFDLVLNAFGRINERFPQVIQTSCLGDIENWPDVEVELEGEAGSVNQPRPIQI